MSVSLISAIQHAQMRAAEEAVLRHLEEQGLAIEPRVEEPTGNHFEVSTKMQLFFALHAGAYPTYEEARQNPFSIVFTGTRYRLNFPRGLHERDAIRAAGRVRRLATEVFSSTN